MLLLIRSGAAIAAPMLLAARGSCGRGDGYASPAGTDRAIGNNQLRERKKLCDLTLNAANGRRIGAVVHSLLEIDAVLLILIALDFAEYPMLLLQFVFDLYMDLLLYMQIPMLRLYIMIRFASALERAVTPSLSRFTIIGVSPETEIFTVFSIAAVLANGRIMKPKLRIAALARSCTNGAP